MMHEQQRLYVQQYTPAFTVFVTLVIAAFTYAINRPSFEIVFVIVPYFVLVIIHLAIGQAYMIAVFGAKLRDLELRFKKMNDDRWLANWESVYAAALVFPPILRLRRTGRSQIRVLNPVFAATIFIALAVLPMMAYSAWNGHKYLVKVVNLQTGRAYLLVTLLLMIGMVIQGFAFFFVGGHIERAFGEISGLTPDEAVTQAEKAPEL